MIVPKELRGEVGRAVDEYEFEKLAWDIFEKLKGGSDAVQQEAKAMVN